MWFTTDKGTVVIDSKNIVHITDLSTYTFHDLTSEDVFLLIKFEYSIEGVLYTDDSLVLEPYDRNSVLAKAQIFGGKFSDSLKLYRGLVTYYRQGTDYTVPVGAEYIEGTFAWGSIPLKKFELPKTVRAIGKHMFFDFVDNMEITIPDHIICISEYAFSNQYSVLDKLVLSPKTKIIKRDAFCLCKIKELVIPYGCETIFEKGSFTRCTIDIVKIPKGYKLLRSTLYKCHGKYKIEEY